MEEKTTLPDAQISEAQFTRENYSQFFECSALKKGELMNRISTSTMSEEFSVEQEQLHLHKIEEKKEKDGLHMQFMVANHVFKCKFIKSGSFENDKPTALLCIKDNHKLLNYTLNNMKVFDVDRYCNVLVIEDRPNEDAGDIQRVTEEYGHSYLSVNYDQDFNFSMLNNVGAAVCDALGNKEIVLWNSDVWVADDSTFPEILRLHVENKADISGAKLLYPDFEWEEDGDKDKVTSRDVYFKDNSHDFRGTVQHGGIIFSNVPIAGKWTYMPNHDDRFGKPDGALCNSDKGILAVTGAFMIIKLSWYRKVGGLNPSLARGFQDIDLCLRSDRVFYFGKDKFLYHDESVSIILGTSTDDEKVKKHHAQLFECGVLWQKLHPYAGFMKDVIFKNVNPASDAVKDEMPAAMAAKKKYGV
jgi:hypothetical protein